MKLNPLKGNEFCILRKEEGNGSTGKPLCTFAPAAFTAMV